MGCWRDGCVGHDWYHERLEVGALFLPLSQRFNVNRSRFFDHWAHLGGAAFGVAYYAYGPRFWHKLRQTTELEPQS